MKDSRQFPISFSVEDVRDKTSERTAEVPTLHEQKVNTITVENNPKIDRELLSKFHRVTEEYEHLVAASKGVVRITQGADYNIAHPFASKDRPTNAYHHGQSVNTDKKT